MTERSYIQANDESRARLARLISTLTPERLAIDLGAGWTVASALGHMGFWDRWQADRWRKMLAGDWTADGASVVEAEHLANEALEPYWATVAAPGVPALALEAAERLDAIVAAAPDTLVDSLEGTPSAYLLHRHRHRGEHLDHIDRSIAAAEAARSDSQAAARSYVEGNRSSLARLVEIAGRLTPADLELPTGEGEWTVGQVIGHLGFWDRFLAARWRAALKAGPGAQPVGVPGEWADLLNDALAPAWRSFATRAPEAAVGETLAAAEELDAMLAGLPPVTPVGEILAERPRLLERSQHRLDHLDQVARALSAPGR